MVSGAWQGARGIWLGLLILVLAIIVGRIAWRLTLVILGMVTSKYELWPGEYTPLLLDPDAASLLHDTVADVCRSMGNTRPDEIRVSPVPECYVLEQRQFGIRPQRCLTLVLGLPELMVMTVAELRMVIAHEMVHFRGGDTTVTVFLFRFLESLRRAIEPMARCWWRWIDPIYWLFAGFYRMVSRFAQPIQWRQERNADMVSEPCTAANWQSGRCSRTGCCRTSLASRWRHFSEPGRRA